MGLRKRGATTARISFVLPVELKSALEELAEEENRTLSNYILRVVSTHVEERNRRIVALARGAKN